MTNSAWELPFVSQTHHYPLNVFLTKLEQNRTDIAGQIHPDSKYPERVRAIVRTRAAKYCEPPLPQRFPSKNRTKTEGLTIVTAILLLIPDKYFYLNSEKCNEYTSKHTKCHKACVVNSSRSNHVIRLTSTSLVQIGFVGVV